MHARVTRYEGNPQHLETAIKAINEQVIPGAKKIAGFKGGYWLIDRASGKGFSVTLFESESALRASGKGFSVTLFESESALRASEDASAKLRSDAATASGAKITGVERYEVIAEVPVQAPAMSAR